MISLELCSKQSIPVGQFPQVSRIKSFSNPAKWQLGCESLRSWADEGPTLANTSHVPNRKEHDQLPPSDIPKDIYTHSVLLAQMQFINQDLFLSYAKLHSNIADILPVPGFHRNRARKLTLVIFLFTGKCFCSPSIRVRKH